MKKLLPFIILIFVVLGCGNNQPQSYTTPQTVKSEAERTAFEMAMVTVGLDEGTGKVGTDDVKIEKVRVLIDSLSKQTGEKPFMVSEAADSTANYVENTNGRKITRQQILTDYERFNSNMDAKTKKNSEGQKLRDLMKLYAIFKYAK